MHAFASRYLFTVKCILQNVLAILQSSYLCNIILLYFIKKQIIRLVTDKEE